MNTYQFLILNNDVVTIIGFVMCVLRACVYDCIYVFVIAHVHLFTCEWQMCYMLAWHTITDKDSMVDNAVLMEPPSSGKLLKTASFTDEGTL